MTTHRKTIGTISLKSGEVEWAIDNIFSYTGKDRSYCSPCFNISSTEWFLTIYPNGHTSNNSAGYISLYLEMSSVQLAPVSANFSFAIKKADGTVENYSSHFCVFEDEALGFPRFLSRSSLLERKSELAPWGTLTVTCTLQTEKDMEISNRNMDILSQEFADLFISKSGCDATLKVMGEEFPVHKIILSARSPVFAKMFETDMSEKRTGIVNIPDCVPEAFRVFLLYLYSGKIENLSDNAFELYKISDKYNIEYLKTRCILWIMANVSMENLFDVVLFGYQFDVDIVNTISQKFFIKNFADIVQTDKWDEFVLEQPSIANGLLKEMGKRMKTTK